MEWKGGGDRKILLKLSDKRRGGGGGEGGGIGSNLGESIRCGYWKNRGVDFAKTI